MAEGGKDIKHNESCVRHDYEPFLGGLYASGEHKVKVVNFFHIIILFFPFT